MKVRALTDLALRKSPDPKSPQWEEWYEWPKGVVFDAPAHLKVDLGVARGVMEIVTKGDADG